jgi:hypothetical protein
MREEDKMKQREENPCPQLALRFEPGGQTLTGDFDTGALLTFLSYEWLVENGLIKTAASSIMAIATVAGRTDAYKFAHVSLSARLLAGNTSTGIATVKAQAVRDWKNSPFSRQGARLALIGRDILTIFGANVEIDGVTGETRITTQNWQAFEAEVANLFRALGLNVQRDYNLAGNQVDILLSEKTTSGKTLRTIVECKFHRNPVGNQYIRQLSSVFEFAKASKLADHAILVSSSGFTKDARLVAEAAGVELLEIDDLRTRVPAQPQPPSPPPPTQEPKRKEPGPKTAFIIMPFRDDYRDTYMLGIRETLAKHGFVCRRADEVEFNGRIMDQILDLIRTSDLIVAEVSESNPNVYYELGISHATGKNVVLCTRGIGQIPFDIRDLNHIVYSDIVDLREKLANRVRTLVIPMEDIEQE